MNVTPTRDARPAVGFRAAVLEDHRFLRSTRAKYSGATDRARDLPIDVVTKIGFQMMVAVRVMHACRDHGLTPLAAVVSRLIRHLYGAEIHWGASIAPGVCIVHGTGLVIGRNAVIGPRCILFQGVTLGESTGSDMTSGAPTLMADVHVGVNAVLVGPIVIGEGTKVMANTVVDVDVAPRSIVVAPVPAIVPRAGQRGRSTEHQAGGQ